MVLVLLQDFNPLVLSLQRVDESNLTHLGLLRLRLLYYLLKKAFSQVLCPVHLLIHLFPPLARKGILIFPNLQDLPGLEVKLVCLLFLESAPLELRFDLSLL